MAFAVNSVESLMAYAKPPLTENVATSSSQSVDVPAVHKSSASAFVVPKPKPMNGVYLESLIGKSIKPLKIYELNVPSFPKLSFSEAKFE